jgi:hypothetical protein
MAERDAKKESERKSASEVESKGESKVETEINPKPVTIPSFNLRRTGGSGLLATTTGSRGRQGKGEPGFAIPVGAQWQGKTAG